MTTVIAEVALVPAPARSPLMVAVMIALPGATAATVPDGETVAIAGSDVVQVKSRSTSWPEASLTVTAS